MKVVVRIALLVTLVVAAFGMMPQTEKAEASSGCYAFHGYFPNISIPTGATIVDVFDAGDTIMITAVPTQAVPSVEGLAAAIASSHYLMVDGATVAGPVAIGEPLTYTFQSTGTHTIVHELIGRGVVNISWSCAAMVAGCDVSVALPSTAVVGSITDNAAVYGAPGVMSDVVLEMGKTFWMDGVDESGMYRKVLISCDWIWVEASKTGPNYDEVWNGTPLPGHTVD